MSNDAHTKAWLAFLADPTVENALAYQQLTRKPKPAHDYDGANPSFLADELALMRKAELAHSDFVEALRAVRQHAAYHATSDNLTELIDALADLRSDHIIPVMRHIEEAIEQSERGAEQRAAIASTPKVL